MFFVGEEILACFFSVDVFRQAVFSTTNGASYHVLKTYEGVVFLLRNQVFCAHTQMEVEHAM